MMFGQKLNGVESLIRDILSMTFARGDDKISDLMTEQDQIGSG